MLEMYKLVEALMGTDAKDGLVEMNGYVDAYFTSQSGGSSAAADVEAAQAEDKKPPPKAPEKVKCITNTSYKKIQEFLELRDSKLEKIG